MEMEKDDIEIEEKGKIKGWEKGDFLTWKNKGGVGLLEGKAKAWSESNNTTNKNTKKRPRRVS